jgi:catechol 2,3-dioxygenase-like lactoylglutathione lyase family enzyme
MTVKRMDNVGIVVEDIDAAIEFFTELGLELEGRATVGSSRETELGCANGVRPYCWAEAGRPAGAGAKLRG